MGKFQDLTGQRFGRLVAIKPIGKSKKHGTIWECQCDCGNTVNQPINKLVFDRVKSCGCYRKEFKTFNAKYDYKTRLYNIWNKMKDRCNNNKIDCYKNYGGRGIFVCKEWVDNFYNFKTWAINNGYDDSLTIDRINNNGNYEPNNCRWATRTQQANNTRTNRLLTYNGVTKTFTEWAKFLGIENSTLYGRIKRNLSEDEIFYKGDLRYGKKRND